MKRSLEILVLAVISLVWVVGCAQREVARTDASRPVGYEGTMVNADAVKDRITRDSGINPNEITVVTDKGKVFVSGWVPSEDERGHAMKAARRAHGVTAVDDHLRIGHPGSDADRDRDTVRDGDVVRDREGNIIRDRDTMRERDVRDRDMTRDRAAMTSMAAGAGDGVCTLVSDAWGWAEDARAHKPDLPTTRGKPVDVQVYRDWDPNAARTARSERMTREEMLTGRERSEVRQEIREGDRTTMREAMREERKMEEPGMVSEAEAARDRDGNLIRDREGNLVRDRDVVRDREGNIVRDSEGNIARDRDRTVAHDRDRDRDRGNLIWSGKLKHRDAIHIAGPSTIRFTYDIGGVHGEKEAACNNGPIYVP